MVIFVGGVQFTVFWMLAEALYPNYSIMNNYISDLGTNCSAGAGACYVPPAWLMFNVSQAVFGILIVLGAYYLQLAYEYKPATVMIAIAGAALIGVGVFNESWDPWHSLFSLITFLFAGLSAIVTFRLQRPPMSYLSALLGAISLVALLLYIPGTGSFGSTIGIGPGGLERMIVYPVLVWAIGFGGHMMGRS